MRTILRSRLALVALATAAALAAGCGQITTPDTTGSGTSAAAPGTSGTLLNTGSQYATYYKPNGTATISAGQTLKMQMGDLYFQPNTLTVAKGTPVTIDLVNNTPLPHTFTLPVFHVNQVLNPGQTATVTFTPDRTGTFYFYCAEPGHTEGGMVGKLTVQ
jgi:uncharacterized cupredoxin-like copper-binding protein